MTLLSAFRTGVLVHIVLLSHPLAAQTGGSVVISQVYGGGGNSGASLRNDFIELFNRGSAAVDITGWSVQHASATGMAWDRTVLSGTVAPGQYYLVQEAQGAGGTAALPAADAAGAIMVNATSGKIALVRTSVLLSGASPSTPDLVDLVGYGSANFALGRPAGVLSNTAAAVRRDGGCSDTRDNFADFSVSAPFPRNRQSPRNPCGGGPPPARHRHRSPSRSRAMAPGFSEGSPSAPTPRTTPELSQFSFWWTAAPSARKISPLRIPLSGTRRQLATALMR